MLNQSTLWKNYNTSYEKCKRTVRETAFRSNVHYDANLTAVRDKDIDQKGEMNF